MPFFTPNGLKIRLDPELIDEIVRPLSTQFDLNDVLLDVELWENLPTGFITVSTSLAALLTGSVMTTLIVATVAFIVGTFIRSLIYSDTLRVLFPLFLGSWMFRLVQTIGTSIFLVLNDNHWAALALCVINLSAHLGVFEIIDLPLSPLRMMMRRTLGLQPTHQEGVFVAICNRRADKLGINLNWDEYSQD